MKIMLIICLAIALGAIAYIEAQHKAAIAGSAAQLEQCSMERNVIMSALQQARSELADALREVSGSQKQVAALQLELGKLQSEPETPLAPVETVQSPAADTTAIPLAPAPSVSASTDSASSDVLARVTFLRNQIRGWQRQLREKEDAWREEDRKGGLKATNARDRQSLRDRVALSISQANQEIARLGNTLQP